MPHIQTINGYIYSTGTYKADAPTPPLILIHGAGGTRQDWPPDLRRHPNTLTIDLPGHGKSDGEGRQSIEDYASEIAAFMDALHIPKAVMVGHSMGGGIAQMLALTLPSRVSALVLIGTGAKLTVHPDILEKVKAHQAEVMTVLKDQLWSAKTPPEIRDLAYEKLMETPAEVVYGDYIACNKFDIRERLQEINAPTLVIGGTEDKMTPHKYSLYLQGHIPNATLVTIEDGGHMMALEQPEFVTQTILDWLSTVGEVT